MFLPGSTLQAHVPDVHVVQKWMDTDKIQVCQCAKKLVDMEQRYKDMSVASFLYIHEENGYS